MAKEELKNRVLNGGRGSGQSLRLLCEVYENRIAELKQQIEQMQCCGNCKFSNQEGAYTIVCKVGGVDKTDYINIDDNQVCDKWELREIKEND